MKQDRADGWLPATWRGRRGLWRLVLLALILTAIGRVACMRPADTGGEDISYRDAERNWSAPRSIAATTRSTARANAVPSSSCSASANSGKGHGA